MEAQSSTLISMFCKWGIYFDHQVDEMEIPRAAAERSLREHKGDVVEALVSLTNWDSEIKQKFWDVKLLAHSMMHISWTSEQFTVFIICSPAW